MITKKQLISENEELSFRLAEAEDLLNKIREGEVDAIVVSGAEGDQMFSLSSAETPYRIIIEEMNEGAVVLTAEGMILYCNRRFAELVAVAPEQIVGTIFSRFIAEADLITYNTLFQTGLHGKCKGTFTYYLPNNHPAYFHLLFSPLPQVLFGDVCIIVTDISELRQKEEELRDSHEILEQLVSQRTAELSKTVQELSASQESVFQMMEDAVESKNRLEILNRKLLEEVNERKQTEIALFDANNYLENLFNYANAPIIVWDPQFRITRFNHAFEYLTGRTEADVAGQPLEILFPPDFANSAMMLIRQTLTGQRWESVEIKILHIDQSVRTVLWNSATLFSPDGEMPVATIAQGQDISDRKIIEEKLQKLNATLEQKVAERTKQLLANNKELAFHLNEIEQFTYIASHDLQEPLRTLISFSKLLNGSYSANLTENQLKFLSFINDSATRMQNLVKGLMEYSMLGKEKVKTDVNCNKILEEVISDMSESISSSNATITIGNLPIINGYSTELRLLFQNLINNALKFGKKDVPPQIKISSERKSGDWLFSIQDNGIGIDIKDKDKIFVIFKRMHNRDEYEGSGIGLAHCKKIVELHGGSIWIESTPGIGSLFMFTIPIV